jgi:hypothetical protein
MPQNLTSQTKIDKEFRDLNSAPLNKARYLALKAEGAHLHVKGFICPPGYELIRTPDTSTGFKVALLCHTTEEVTYLIDCTILPDVHLNEKPVTQVLLWKSLIVQHDSVLRGLATKIFQDYLLDQYNIVASDGQHTTEGRTFWVRQIGLALYNNLYAYRYDRTHDKLTPILDPQEVIENKADLWGDDAQYQNILALISRNKLP